MVSPGWIRRLGDVPVFFALMIVARSSYLILRTLGDGDIFRPDAHDQAHVARHV